MLLPNPERDRGVTWPSEPPGIWCGEYLQPFYQSTPPRGHASLDNLRKEYAAEFEWQQEMGLENAVVASTVARALAEDSQA